MNRGKIETVLPAAKNLRSATGFRYEMNLLLASLRRVEVRVEPQSITDFLKWKNRMAEYNRGTLPEGLAVRRRRAQRLPRTDLTPRPKGDPTFLTTPAALPWPSAS